MKIICIKNIIFTFLLMASFGVYSQGLVRIADYPLINDLVDDTGIQLDAYLYGNPPPTLPGNGVELCQDGIWSAGHMHIQSVYTPILKGFDLDDFEVEIEFKPTGFSTPQDVTPFKAVIMGGHSARWIGILLENTGRIGFKFNNDNTNITWTNTTLTLDGLYHHGRITYDNGHAEMYIDQQLVHTQELPPLIPWLDDFEFLTADLSYNAPFYGCVRNLKVKSTTLIFKNGFEAL